MDRIEAFKRSLTSSEIAKVPTQSSLEIGGHGSESDKDAKFLDSSQNEPKCHSSLLHISSGQNIDEDGEEMRKRILQKFRTRNSKSSPLATAKKRKRAKGAIEKAQPSDEDDPLKENKNPRMKRHKKTNPIASVPEMGKFQQLGIFNRGKVSKPVELRKGAATLTESIISKQSLSQKRKGSGKKKKQEKIVLHQETPDLVITTVEPIDDKENNGQHQDPVCCWRVGSHYSSLRNRLLKRMHETRTMNEKRKNSLISEHISMISKNIVNSYFSLTDTFKTQETCMNEIETSMADVKALLDSLNRKKLPDLNMSLDSSTERTEIRELNSCANVPSLFISDIVPSSIQDASPGKSTSWLQSGMERVMTKMEVKTTDLVSQHFLESSSTSSISFPIPPTNKQQTTDTPERHRINQYMKHLL